MRKLLKIIFGLVFVIIIAAFIGGYIFVRKFDLNSYKNTIEEQVYAYTGRQLKINGNAHLGISLIPTLVVDDITLSNAAWAKQPQMLNVKSLKVQISILPLLKKNIVIRDVTLIEPQIYLEKNASGMNNWTFGQTQTAKVQRLGFAQLEEMALRSKDASPLPAAVQQISIESITLEKGFVQYIDATSKKPLELIINTLHFNMDSLDSPLRAKIDVVYDHQPIEAKLTLGSFNELFASSQPFAIDVEGKAFNVNAVIQGALFNVLGDVSYDVMVEASSPAGNFDLPKTTLKTGLKGSLSKVTATIQNLMVADNQISGTVIAKLSQKIPHIDAILTSPSLNLQTLQVKKSAADFSLIRSAHALESVPNTPVPYDLLRHVNGNIALSVKKLIIDEAMSANNVSLKAALNNGVLNIKPLDLDFGNGRVVLNAVLNAGNQTLTLVLNSKDVLIQDLHKEFSVDGTNDFGVISGGKTFLNADLSSAGTTYRQLYQNLKGELVVIISKSNLQTGGLKFLTNNFVSQLLSVLKIDTKRSEKLDLDCAVVRADFINGKANFPDGIAVQSDKLTVSSNGKINLLNDKIDFSIAPSFGLDAGLTQTISSLIKVTGTLEKPKFVLDDKQALQAIVGVATTGGLAYLGSQTITSNGSPCYTALKGTSYQRMVPQPSAAEQAKQNTVEATKAAYRDTEDAVKQELKNLKQNAKDVINFFKGKQ